MRVDIYIGTDHLDFEDTLNVQYSIGDIRDILSGRNNKSFTLKAPATDTNRQIFKFTEELQVFDEIDEEGTIYIDDISILTGKVIVTKATRESFYFIITSESWLDAIRGLSIRDLDLSAMDHVYSASVISTSWASGTTYIYPLVNFGKLADLDSSETGESGAETIIMDYYPMFRLKEIMEKILSPWTINSALLATAEFQKFYLFSQPAVKETDFIQDKDFEAYVGNYLDNFNSDTIPTTATVEVEMDKTTYANRCDIDDETSDDGNNYSGDRYTIPETGTYRFVLEIEAHYGYSGSGVPNSQEATYKIMRRRAAADTELETVTQTALVAWGQAQTLDTGYIYCEANDEIWISVYLAMEFTNVDGGDRVLEIYVGEGTNTSIIPRFYSISNEWCLFPGGGISVDTETWLPDISQIDFLKAVKHMFNLRFGIDRNAQTIRIEPHDDFFSDNERDWTEYCDNDDVEIDTISKEYKKTQKFTFKEDSGDFAIAKYKEENQVLPNEYEEEMDSEYSEDGIEKQESPAFADTVIGKMRPLGWWATDVVKIWKELEEGAVFPQRRISSWAPRIFYWDGATAGPTNLEFEGTGYANYPKVSIPDWNDLFDDYWINNFHLIDQGKLVTLKLNLPISEIQRFMMTVGTEAEEGFRAKYKIKIRGEQAYGYINRLVTDGKKTKGEFIILK